MAGGRGAGRGTPRLLRPRKAARAGRAPLYRDVGRGFEPPDGDLVTLIGRRTGCSEPAWRPIRQTKYRETWSKTPDKALLKQKNRAMSRFASKGPRRLSGGGWPARRERAAKPGRAGLEPCRRSPRPPRGGQRLPGTRKSLIIQRRGGASLPRFSLAYQADCDQLSRMRSSNAMSRYRIPCSPLRWGICSGSPSLFQPAWKRP